LESAASRRACKSACRAAAYSKRAAWRPTIPISCAPWTRTPRAAHPRTKWPADPRSLRRAASRRPPWNTAARQGTAKGRARQTDLRTQTRGPRAAHDGEAL
jgi:hypothetical protein